MPNFNQVLAELRVERNRVQHEVRNLDEAIRLIHDLNGSVRNGARSGKRPTRSISATGRARIAAAQRARWASVRKGKVVPINRVPKSRTRRISAAGRARIAAAQRRRWAALRSKQRK